MFREILIIPSSVFKWKHVFDTRKSDLYGAEFPPCQVVIASIHGHLEISLSHEMPYWPSEHHWFTGIRALTPWIKWWHYFFSWRPAKNIRNINFIIPWYTAKNMDENGDGEVEIEIFRPFFTRVLVSRKLYPEKPYSIRCAGNRKYKQNFSLVLLYKCYIKSLNITFIFHPNSQQYTIT